MRRSLIIAAVAVVLVAGAYLAGYWPERTARVAAETEAGDLRTRLAAADARVRAGGLLGQALTLKEAVMLQNYGQALEMASSFFDAVATEADRSEDSGMRDALTDVLAQRDGVTAALAKADPSVLDTLHAMERRLRTALGYRLPPELAPSPA